MIPKQNISLILLATVGLTLVGGCTFLKETPEGKKVRVLTAQEVGHCTQVGKLTSSVVDKVGFIARSREAVAEDVILNARNSAADMGGDTMVAVGKLAEGKQTFEVYKCLNP
jgi:hypothetical protein